MQRKLRVFSVAAALLLNAVGVAAQEPARRVVVAPPAVDDVEVFIAQGPAGAPPPPAQIEMRGDNLIFMATEMSFSGKLVKGAPYSAQAVTESVQTLSDGNRIVRKSTAQVYRDTEGRTRREQTAGPIGLYALPAGQTPQTIFINDPVAGFSYILEPSSRIARKLPRMEMRFKTEGGAAQGGAVTFERHDATVAAVEKLAIERTYNVRVPAPGAPPAPAAQSAPAPPPARVAVAAPPAGDGPQVEFFHYSSKADRQTEKLEARAFDGVQAEGERTTTTIPAGEIGNEQPIQIVDERWYSPELQVVVMTRHADPRYGETTYRLTNISRTEPAGALFQVPADYTIREAGGPGVRRTFRRQAPPPPAQEN